MAVPPIGFQGIDWQAPPRPIREFRPIDSDRPITFYRPGNAASVYAMIGDARIEGMHITNWNDQNQHIPLSTLNINEQDALLNSLGDGRTIYLQFTDTADGRKIVGFLIQRRNLYNLHAGLALPQIR